MAKISAKKRALMDAEQQKLAQRIATRNKKLDVRAKEIAAERAKEIAPVARTYTAAQLGARCGVSTPAIYQKLQQGMTPDQIIAHYELKKAEDAQYNSLLRSTGKESQQYAVEGGVKGKALALRDSTGALVTTTEANLRNAIATAEKNELDFKIRSGELAPIGQVRAFMGGCVIRCRDILMGMVDLADRVRQAPDLIAARGLMDAEHRRALAELSKFAQFTSAGQLESIDGGLVSGASGVAKSVTKISKHGKRRGRPPGRKMQA